MAGELSGILEHVDRISALDLDGVEPTTHVVALENVLRADEPSPSLPRERALEPRPTRPTAPSASPRRRRERRLLELTAARGDRAGSRRATSPRPSTSTPTRQAAAGDELGAYLWRADAGADAGSGGEPLRGLPVAVKDIFCTEGIVTTAGSRILEGYRPPYTATAVARLADAGARVLGKTNMDEFAMGSSNENSAYGPVRNPWDRERVPGGSSGGSAAAVAGRLAPWALGTDTGGSIRQPAALCGIVGLKPTYGAVSRYGMIAFASSLDQCGPLTRDVTDAALLLARDAGPRPARLDLGRDRRRGASCRRARISTGLRVGVARDFSHHAEGVEPGVAEVFERSIELIERLGAEVEEIELPHAEHGISAYYVIAPAEASANLARYDGVRYGARAPTARRPRRRCTSAPARRASAPRSSGGSCSAPTRSPPATTTPTTAGPEGADDDRRGLRGRLRARRPDRHADLAHGRLRARRARPRTRWRCTSPTTARCRCRWPGSRRSRSPPASPARRRRPRAAGRPADRRRPAFAEAKLLDAAHALEKAIGFDVPRRGGARR